MKKVLLSFSALVILGLAQLSAQIINSDFETWTANSLSANNAKDPNSGNGTSGWWSFNMMSSSVLGSSPLTVFQDSLNPSPEHGNYSAKIVSAVMTSTSYNDVKPYGFPYPDTNGLLITAYMNITFPTVVIKPGIPCTNALKSFSFYYRYIPNALGDTCSCSIGMFHYNHVTGHSNAVGGGYWSNSSTKTGWTQATVNISYTPDSTLVDTIVIQFSACALKSSNIPKPNDTMNIDYSSVVLGLNNINAEHDNVTVYPNPANSELNLAITGQFQANLVEVYDITGKAMGTYTIHNNFLTINTQSFNSGLYFYKLLDDSGNQLNVGKFSIIK